MSYLKQVAAAAGFATLIASTSAQADNINSREIGEVTTVWKMIGPDHKIKVQAFNDPEIEGVTCWLSRPVTGGISGGLGLAEDKSDASIACRQTGPIVVTGDIDTSIDGEEVYNENRSIWFKELHVQRFFDQAASTFVYLTYSDKLIDGSPKNAISTVVARPWVDEGIQPDFGN